MATGNKFDLLDDEVAVKKPNLPLTREADVSYAMAAAGAMDTSSKRAEKPKDSGEAAMIAAIVSQVLATIQPIIVQSVTAAVAAAMKELMKELQKPLENLRHTESVSNQGTALEGIDRLEQYGRRDNVRIYGLEETRNENTTEKVNELAADIGVAITANDISVSHRLPQSGKRAAGKAKPIIVKFVRRSTKQLLMRSKKELRNKENRKNVYVEEDLTPLRSRMARSLRGDPGIKTVWSIDGRIFAIRKKDGKEEKVVIESAQDLRKVGWTAEEIKNIISR